MVTHQRLVEVFVTLADTLVDDFDAVDLMRTLAETAVELVGADAVGLMLADQQGLLHLIASSSERARLLELFELQQGRGPCLDCYSGGHPVVNIGHAAADVRWPGFGTALQESGYASVHALPMRLRGHVIGAMNLFLSDPRDLSSEDLALGQGLADIATVGLLQERAISERQLLAEQLQTALNSRVTLEQAKGILAERHGLEVDEAFMEMRRAARGSGRSLKSVAAAVIRGEDDALSPRRVSLDEGAAEN